MWPKILLGKQNRLVSLPVPPAHRGAHTVTGISAAFVTWTSWRHVTSLGRTAARKSKSSLKTRVRVTEIAVGRSGVQQNKQWIMSCGNSFGQSASKRTKYQNMLWVLSESITFFRQKAVFWTLTVTSDSHFLWNCTVHAPPPRPYATGWSMWSQWILSKHGLRIQNIRRICYEMGSISNCLLPRDSVGRLTAEGSCSVRLFVWGETRSALCSVCTQPWQNRRYLQDLVWIHTSAYLADICSRKTGPFRARIQEYGINNPWRSIWEVEI